MRNKLLVVFLSIFLIATLNACAAPTFQSKATYFNGDVLVEYQQTRAHGEDDYLTLTFYEPGTYHVTFSTTPDKDNRGSEYMPKSFTINITDTPHPYLIDQYILPDFLRVTIQRGDNVEFHDFQ